MPRPPTAASMTASPLSPTVELRPRKHIAMDIRTATDQLRAKVGADSGLGAVLKFDCGADGAVVIDATKVPNTLSNDASLVADCTVALGVATLGDLLSGELEPTTGFMMGKFKVSGDMSVALKLQRIV